MITQELSNQLQKIIESKGMKLYDIETLRENDLLLLRISLFKQGGISLQDCEDISTIISPILDVELQNIESYHLEVSSPGIERILKKPTHFLYSIGEQVEIRLYNKTTIKGRLHSYHNENIEIIPLQQKSPVKSKKPQCNQHINSDISEAPLSIALKDCKKVKTIFDWNTYQLQD